MARYCEAGNIKSDPPITYAENVCLEPPCIKCPEVYKGIGYDNCFNDMILAEINRLRDEHKVPDIQIDETMAKKAQEWAQ